MSSNGFVEFDAKTGMVIQCDMPKGLRPARVDVNEWLRHYPGEKVVLANEHDILDFGFWTAKGKYVPPSKEWREDFKRNRKPVQA